MTDQKIVCIYHADCADGFAAAWAVHRRFGAGNVDFVEGRYGKEPELSVPCRYHSTSEPCTDCLGTGYEMGGGPFLNRDVLIVDFSYPRSTLEALAREARSVLVLDHHATAAEQLSDVPQFDILTHCDWEIWQQDVGFTEGNLYAVFDMNRSGAGITWDYLHPGKPRPRLIDLVEDRDLWRFKHGPETRQFHAVAASYGYVAASYGYGYEVMPENFERWDVWHQYAESWHSAKTAGFAWTEGRPTGAWNRLLDEGAAILRAEARLVSTILTSSRRTMKIAGHMVPVACCPSTLVSEVGNQLLEIIPQSERDGVLFAFHEACPMPTADQIIEWTERYPTIADDIRAHAAVSRDWVYRGGLTADEPTKIELDQAFNRAIDQLMKAPNNPPFSATYYDGADGCRHFSLRSTDASPAHCGDMARALGTRFGRPGGGHKNAAGFEAPLGWEGE